MTQENKMPDEKYDLHGTFENNDLAEIIKQYTALEQKNARLVEALEGLKNWSHWANEKMGFGDEPKFPEWNKAKQALAENNSQDDQEE